MVEIKQEEVGKVRVGRYILIDGAACEITNIQKSAPGKHGHAKYRIEAVDLLTGAKKVVIYSGHARVDVPIIEKKTAQVLSVSGDTAQLMDLETYETFEAEIPAEFKDKISAGGQVVFWTILNKKVIKQVK